MCDLHPKVGSGFPNPHTEQLVKKPECTRREPDSSFIKPGYGFVPSEFARLWTVVGATVAVTLYDSRRGMGGMTHYCLPHLRQGQPATSLYAIPALSWLIRQFLMTGSNRADLEAQVFGGAENRDHADYRPQLHKENVQVGVDTLTKNGITISTMDVGGSRGRKVIFNCLTGESVVARVAQIRRTDWYPRLSSGAS